MHKTAILAARTGPFLAILLLSACASIQSNISNGASFATAGITYIDAIPAVLDESFALTVEANSTQLLLSRAVLSEDERSDRLSASDELLEQRLSLLRNLNTHALMLRSYFIALRALTTADHASGITEATQNLVTNMAELRPGIAESNIAGVRISDLIGPVVNLVVGAYQNASLNAELKARGEAIERELALQKAATNALVDQMKDDAQLIVQVAQLNPIFEEFVSATKVSSSWSDKRVLAFKQTIKLQSLDNISKAANNLHASWITLVEKRDDASSLGLLIQDVEQMLDIARQFRANEQMSSGG